MKILSILAASLLVGCASPRIPEFPDIKDHYLVEVRDEEVPAQLLESIVNRHDIPDMFSELTVRCLHFEVVSKIPYKIKFLREEKMNECHLVGGYKPKDSISIYNWLDDVKESVEKFKHCFRK
jgi:hypothetical protein